MHFGTDVVVVGSGATGGWACKILTEAGFDVTLLEAGPAATADDCPTGWYERCAAPAPTLSLPRQSIQQRHPAFCAANSHLWVDDVDHPYITSPEKPFVWIRARHEGGRSNLWGGQCWRLTEHELGAPDVDGFGQRWPIRYEELEPYYEEVERYQEVGGRCDGADEMPDQVVNGDVDLTSAEERFAMVVKQRWKRVAVPCRSASSALSDRRGAGAWPRFSSLGSTLPDALATGRLHIVNNTIVTRLATDEGSGHVRQVEYLDAITGREEHLRARAFLLCASTVESTRILLNSAAPGHRQGLGNGSGVLGRFLMDHNASCVMGAIDAPEGRGTFFGGRGGVYLPRFESVAGAPGFKRSYGVWAALGRPMGEGVNAVLTATGETLPYAGNRVTLSSSQVDRWGVPIPHIEYAPRDNEHLMLRHQERALLALALAAGVRLLNPPQTVAPGAMVHEVGTARMGASPETSFCNAYAQSWELQNLFVPDGACWTTSAYQNPTLTMMAITLRASRHASRWLAELSRNQRPAEIREKYA